MAEAILREKRIKRWRRAWKIALIEQSNPDWGDLYPDLFAVPESVVVTERSLMGPG